jgi:5-methylcytosine-specific restriction endonuclease McrBC regulatory subunit McrC
MPTTLNADEYDVIGPKYFVQQWKDELRALAADADKAKFLGLHFDKGELKASHFVGLVRLDGAAGLTLQVNPKDLGRGKADYFQMFLRCLDDPIVAGRGLTTDEDSVKAVRFWPEQTPLPWQSKNGRVTILLVALFLRELAELSRRHVRRNFVAVERNLIGRVKGRVLIGKNIRRNLTKGRMDRAFCAYQVHDVDNPENQILRAALEQSMRFLRAHHGVAGAEASHSRLWAWGGTAYNALAGVTLRRIHPHDFTAFHYGGFLNPYKEPHRLAKAILTTLGSDPTRELESGRGVNAVLPFAIDMNELFERYCETLLRRTHAPGVLRPGYEKDNLGKQWKVRPDFLVMGDNLTAIVDAKYKPQWGGKLDFTLPTAHESTLRSDLYQLLAYSRHKKVLEFFKGAIPILSVMYPVPEDRPRGQRCSSNLNLKKHRVLKNDIADETEFYRCPVPVPCM